MLGQSGPVNVLPVSVVSSASSISYHVDGRRGVDDAAAPGFSGRKRACE